MHSFWKFPRTANNDCAHLLGIYWNSIGSWKVTGVLRIIKYNARHRLNLLHHRWSVDACSMYFVIIFHTCARVNGLIYFTILSFCEWNYKETALANSTQTGINWPHPRKWKKKIGTMCGRARRWVGKRPWIGCGKTVRASVQTWGRYVARVGLNASKGSGGEEATMSREKSREAKLG